MFDKLDSEFFDDVPWNDISEIDRLVLKERGFFENFYNSAFYLEKIVSDFKWGNRNKNLVIYYIRFFGLNPEIVNILNKAITTTYPPRNLREELRFFYKQNKDIWEQHYKLTLDQGDELPEVLKVYEDDLVQISN